MGNPISVNLSSRSTGGDAVTWVYGARVALLVLGVIFLPPIVLAQENCTSLVEEIQKAGTQYGPEFDRYGQLWSPNLLKNIERLRLLPTLLERSRWFEEKYGEAIVQCPSYVKEPENFLKKSVDLRRKLILSIFRRQNLTAEALRQVTTTMDKDKGISINLRALLGGLDDSGKLKEKRKQLLEAKKEKLKIYLTVARSLKGPEEVEFRNSKGATLLMLAASSGEPELVQALLAKGADVNARDLQGNTAIHEAAATGSKASVELLVAHGADLYARNQQSESALHAAVNELHRYRSFSPLEYHDYGHFELMAWLREKRVISDPKELIALYDKAVEEHGILFLDSYVDRGDAYFYLQRYDEAIADYRHTIEKIEGDIPVMGFRYYAEPYVLSRLGDSYAAKGDRAEAIDTFTKAIESRSSNANAYWKRGNIHYDDKNYDLAIADYKRLTELAPDYVKAYEQLAFSYHNKGDTKKAIEVYASAVAKGSKNANVFMSRGNLYYDEKNYDLAAADYRRVTELIPDYAPGYEQLAFCYHNKGELEKAVETYTTAVEKGSKNADVFQSRGNIYFGKKDYERAITDYRRATELSPDYIAAYEQLAFSHHNKGNVQKALELYAKAVEKGSRNANVFLFRANLYSEEGNYDRAIQDYRRVTELAPQFANGYGLLGWYLILEGRFEEAETPAQRALELEPKSYAWTVNLGHIYLLTGREAKAREYYEKTVSLVRDDASFREGPLADFDIFIKKGWKADKSRKYKAWMTREWENRNK